MAEMKIQINDQCFNLRRKLSHKIGTQIGDRLAETLYINTEYQLFQDHCCHLRAQILKHVGEYINEKKVGWK